ncbi:MAG TPA: 6,7-dimethyl-8-ribityllumazine synthase [Candidatus Angelobacter sp.]|nr:6,7-dimethyl-8-ribityllumazine synthase [Candidatus Angelobacter sp.]
MIKGITTIRRVASEKEFLAVSALLDSLGFETGNAWKARHSHGQYFLAPAGKIELIGGSERFPADVWVEVSDLDSARIVIEKKKISLVSDITDTDWGGRVLVAEPAKGLKIAFWQKNQAPQDAVEGDLNARGMRFAVVVARWNSFITERLLQGALDALRRNGCRSQDITVVRVPGSFEIPSQARTMAETGKYDAIVTLGCLIRGETTHYEHISTEVTRGIGQSAQETGVPHTYGVLTCENLEQALDRAGLKAGNKGFEAAVSAIEMVSLKRKTGPARKRSASKNK